MVKKRCIVWKVFLVRFLHIFHLFFGLTTSQQFGQTVPNAAHKEGTEQILERHKRIVNAQQNGRQFKVNQEDDDAKVNQSMWSRNQVGFLVQHENNGSHHRSLSVAVRMKMNLLLNDTNQTKCLYFILQAGLHEFHSCWCPSTANQSFQKFSETGTVALQRTDDDHDHIRIWIQFGRMRNTIMNLNKTKLMIPTNSINVYYRVYLLGPVDFFHCTGHHFDGKEFTDFIANVERCVKYQIPDNGADQQLWCVFERSQNWFAQQTVGNHTAGEYH